MKTESIFKNLLAQYCDIAPQDMKNDMRLSEDLGLSSFDLMSFLGDMEDNFDVEINPDNLASVTTISEALQLLNMAYQEA
ncbi:acyl carrier protein [Butyrivibrio fibrisolvens DSM 3071]|uniref:Acyl carrier protein n=1 Tax=Butyrivibrio fibrisolvens DSM 3071 TaxID=1121131 RepID=A0A1M5ZDY6_BUTFI|nr:acyl carrier protein [Butyrivibrio fibrisolvens]SHI22402.1 acyl carrier protein [Butyrivibrio fibrisolvens DSM 3071]